MSSAIETARLTFDHVAEAHDRIRPYIHRTPVLTSDHLNALSGARLFFKCENFQKSGAFKARGACNAVFGLTGAEAARGVGTHSSGNHAAALAYAAARRGIPCRVVMPRNAPQVKKDAVRGYGASIVECDPTPDAREAAMAEVRRETGCEFVHPFDDPRVILGQATCAMELLEDVAGLDALIAPISGGGLISGTCLSARALAPGAKVFGAEPAQMDDAHRSLKAGRLITTNTGDTIADGLRMHLSETTWRVISDNAADILTAEETEIVAAMRLVWARMKIVIEPSSAVAVASVLKNPRIFAGNRVGVILSGGNADLDRPPWIGA